jgi:hypothetical protein
MLALSRTMNDPRLEMFAAQVWIDVALERTAAKGKLVLVP